MMESPEDFTSLVPQKTLVFDEIEDLSDDQIQNLLKEAEERARSRASQSLTLKKDHEFRLPRLNVGELTKPYVRTDSGVARVDPARLVPESERQLANRVRKVEDPVALKQKKIEAKKATAGAQWFDLPKTELTPELKRDLQLIQMRGVLDPHRHYKKEGGKAKAPEFSQVGTIVEGPTEFYSSRIQNRDRKRTFVEEVLAAEAESGRFKKKATDIRNAKSSGKKAHYKALQAKRQPKFRKG